MKRFSFNFIIIFAIFSLIGCATTEISSFKNPDIKISEYKKILVKADVRDIKLRKTLEKDLVSEFTKKEIDSVAYIDIFSPVKTYSETERDGILSENKIDCILSIELLDVQNNSEYIPKTTSTYYTSEYVNGQFINIPHTSTSGGYSASYPTASFEVVLTDAKSGEIALKATANSEGNEFTDIDMISSSFAKQVVAEYLRQE